MRVMVLLLIAAIFLSGCTGSYKHRHETSRRLDSARERLAEGKNKAALAQYEEIADENSGSFDVLSEIGMTLIAYEMEDEAIPFIRRAIDVPPDGKRKHDLYADKRRDSEMYRIIADLYNGMKRIPEAEDAYRLASRLDPTNPWTYNNWGYMYADYDIKPRESLELAKKADAMMPGKAEIIDSVGWAYFRLERYEDAKEALERAVKLSPNDLTVRYHMGRVYEAVGENPSAMVEYGKALSISPAMEDAGKRLKKLRGNAAKIL